jgi:chemotaxis protein methyltransferase CheR
VIEARTTELSVLLDAVLELSGMDFRDYARSSLERRVRRRMAEEGAESISALCELLRADRGYLERLLTTLTIPVTTLFRDPSFFLLFRTQVAPALRAFPFIRLWVAGCATGEEAYSLAILLHEEGLLGRCRIYATDLSDAALARATTGSYPLAMIERYAVNYREAGGAEAITHYYTRTDSETVAVRPFLKDNIVFAQHNLATDASFNEFQVILCRNVMIYFNRRLRERSQRILYESLAMRGFLGLGRSESVIFSAYEECYQSISIRERMYRRVR